jgi:hypothetical protein
MKRDALGALTLVGAMFIGGLVPGCGGGLRPIGPPSAGIATAEEPVLRAALDEAFARLRMQVVEERDGALLVQWGDRTRRGFRFEVAFSANGYTVTFVDSVGMKQQVDPRTGSEVIHGRYRELIEKLHKLVARNLGAQGTATGATLGGGGGSERAIPVTGPVDAGLVQRGFLVAGLDIDSVDPNAGLVTSTYADTGFGYGFIDGEGATLHVAYTGTVYPAEVRVSQQVERCARILVSAGLGVAEELRCEPFTRGVPGRVASGLDRVAAAVRREIEAMQPEAMQPAAPAQSGGSVAVAPEETCTASLPTGQAEQVAESQSDALNGCYERGLQSNPSLAGTANLRLRVDAQGQVTEAAVDGTLGDADVFGCLQQVVMSWRFSPPGGGACASVVIPLQFAPN